jgi:hypothetical protein
VLIGSIRHNAFNNKKAHTWIEPSLISCGLDVAVMPLTVNSIVDQVALYDRMHVDEFKE